MNKISKEKRDKLILICVAIIAVLGGLYTFVLGAQKDQLATLDAQITSTKSKLDKAEVLVRSTDKIEARLAESKKLVETRQEKMAPPGQYYYWFLKLIDQFRKDEKLDTGFIVDITQPEFVEGGLLPKFPYKAASFGLRLNGHYHDIGKFIASVENSFPLFRVQNVRIARYNGAGAGKQTAAKIDNTEGRLTVELKIVTLVKPGTT
jgi:Tfp pilus assembly protein PilO